MANLRAEQRRKAEKTYSRGKIDSVNLIIRESKEVSEALKKQRQASLALELKQEALNERPPIAMLKSNGFSMVPKGSYKSTSFQDVMLDDDIITGSHDLVPRDLPLKHTPVVEA